MTDHPGSSQYVETVVENRPSGGALARSHTRVWSGAFAKRLAPYRLRWTVVRSRLQPGERERTRGPSSELKLPRAAVCGCGSDKRSHRAIAGENPLDTIDITEGVSERGDCEKARERMVAANLDDDDDEDDDGARPDRILAINRTNEAKVLRVPLAFR
ncbi:hypothetical protein ZHAS_00000822 [Anopheles sinensis]|uniref:Uncharacterized protein n=1 Tax=Anopheles sinensis TaxID=74873 RepID=A0A084VAL2_ANOSI|nr:hypothetical protein ZHAS_00000822 [Anopheles sinensis]